jgi:acyl transferase domain-containing protein
MLAAGLSASEIEPYLAKARHYPEEVLAIACYNSPKNVTISGDRHAIESLEGLLRQDGIFSRVLKVNTAYHSPHMLEVKEEYVQLLGDLSSISSGLNAGGPAVEWYSSVTGTLIDADKGLAAEYWAQNLISPVKFKDAIQSMCTNETSKIHRNAQVNSGSAIDYIIEIGPHHALQSAIQDILASSLIQNKVSYLYVLKRNEVTPDAILNVSGSLFCAGFPVDLQAVNNETCLASQELLTDLPPYEFNHSMSFWTESRLSKNLRFRKHPRHELFGAPVLDWNPSQPRWRNFLRRSELPWLMHHQVSFKFLHRKHMS